MGLVKSSKFVFLLGLVVSLVAAFGLAAVQEPPLPEVEVYWDAKTWPDATPTNGTSPTRGRLVANSGGYWYVYDRNDGYNLIAIPNAEVDTVRFDDSVD